jgi:hypothetical protein
LVQALSVFGSVPSRNSLSEKDSDPALRGQPAAPAGGLRQKSALAQPINHSGRGSVIPEECKIIQSSQITHMQIPLNPGAHQRWP